MQSPDAPERSMDRAQPAPIESHASEHLDSILAGRLRQALLLTGIILVVELVGGILSGSLALMSDAGHVTTDVLALGLAWYAVEQTKRPADKARTFGYHRAGILAATANGATLIVLVVVIAYEAVQRFAHPQPVQGGIVIVSALVGVAVNGYIAFNFRGRGGNLNVRAAVLHAVGDMIASIGVIVAGAIILLTGWTFVDPIVSIFIAALIGWNAFRIVLETVNILLEGTPRGLDVMAVRNAITSVDGVLSAHDVHVWCISSEHTAMSCHIVVGKQPLDEAERVMRAVEGTICERFGIGHTTVQLEFLEPCSGDADHLSEHNHPHRKLAQLALAERRRTPLSRRRQQPTSTAVTK
ncbi:MAG: cation diffusion facilitator family transporter [Candidatus Dormibacteraceae bacterium]